MNRFLKLIIAVVLLLWGVAVLSMSINKIPTKPCTTDLECEQMHGPED